MKMKHARKIEADIQRSLERIINYLRLELATDYEATEPKSREQHLLGDAMRIERWLETVESATSRFDGGRVVMTRGVVAALCGDDIDHALFRHQAGDWGEISEEDARANDLGVRKGCRLLSAYRASNGTSFWIITEADRSTTTVLLPEEC